MKVTNQDDQILKSMAVQLPPVFESFKSKSKPNHEPAALRVNHYRRLKKAFENDGMPGVQKYLDKYIKR